MPDMAVSHKLDTMGLDPRYHRHPPHAFCFSASSSSSSFCLRSPSWPSSASLVAVVVVVEDKREIPLGDRIDRCRKKVVSDSKEWIVDGN